MKRRNMVAAGVGACGAAAGLGWGLWSARQATEAGAPTRPDAWWAARFERPEGGELALSDFKGRPFVLNFWATWCPPCVQEMPMLDEFHKQHSAQGWQVLGLALDSLGAVQSYLKRVPVQFPIAIAGLPGLDMSRELGNTKGQLPFTALWDRQGRLVRTQLGPLEARHLGEWTRLKL